MPRGPLSASVGWGELQCHPLLPRMLAFLASSARPSTLRTFPGLRLVGGRLQHRVSGGSGGPKAYLLTSSELAAARSPVIHSRVWLVEP